MTDKKPVKFNWEISSVIICFLLYSNCTFSQFAHDSAHLPKSVSSLAVTDTSVTRFDSLTISPPLKVKSYFSIINDLLSSNKFINVQDAPVYFITGTRKSTGKEFVFYILCLTVLILALFKTFYQGYFNNLFRVFFNTSLRQTQLTDQLLQAKLPSLILNIFFAISAGIFLWLLFTFYQPPRLINKQALLPFCILGIGLLYFAKYCTLKFIGWISAMQQTVDSYIFIIFLVNKISGIVLVPFLVILAFSLPLWIRYITTIAIFVVALFFLSRYIKTYGLLENKLPLNPFHFLIYIVATEIIPIFILYKVTIDYLL
ncbi:MAG: DUF4271 domain-containing protein [Ginsengibacter sp.]